MSENKVDWNSLTGKFFHSTHHISGKAIWQGRIIGNPEPGFYIVELFDWTLGAPGSIRIVSIKEMGSWLFYESDDAMQYAYEHGNLK